MVSTYIPVFIEIILTLPNNDEGDSLPPRSKQNSDLEFDLKLWFYYHPKGVCKGTLMLTYL